MEKSNLPSPCSNETTPYCNNTDIETASGLSTRLGDINLNSIEDKHVESCPTKDDQELEFTEAGKFCLASLCASLLGYLFPEKWDHDFRERCIKFIMTNLEISAKSEPLMMELLNLNEKPDFDGHLQLLQNEPYFLKKNTFENVICNFIAFAVHDGKYDSRWRVLILHLAKYFSVSEKIVDHLEYKIVSCLMKKSNELSEEEQRNANNRKLSAKIKRRTLIGLAAVGGGVLLGITGGLAAPVVGAVVGGLLGSGTIATIVGSMPAAVLIGSLFGTAGGGLTGYRMRKRIGDIEEFELCQLNSELEQNQETIDENTSSKSDSKQIINTLKELHITIAISGWIKDKEGENFTKPWTNLMNGREQYYLKYESSYLLELGSAMDYVLSMAATVATQEALKYTILSGLLSAIMWPSWLLGLSSFIDNPWDVCLRRSAQVGKQLAEVLLAREQGHRPVTLFGYSLGARVIYYCLKEMSERENCEGIIQDAILIGAPCTAQTTEWSKFTRVVAGKIINGYCRGDWLLKFLHRTLSFAVNGVAGLQEIELNNPKMQNIDLTDIVTGHSEYPEKMTYILSYLGVRIIETDEDKLPKDHDSTLSTFIK